MNKLVLFFLFSCFSVFAQNKEINVVFKDAQTNLPIEDVAVYVLKTKLNYVSNVQGKVTFICNESSIIKISNSAYISQTLKSANLKEPENIIFLKKNSSDLDEIILTKQHPQQILKGIVANSISKLSVPARLKVYSREFFKLNGAYNYYNDGLINFQISGKDKNYETTILVDQNRSYGLIEQAVENDLLGYNLNDIMKNYYSFKYINPILESSAKKDYDFIIKSNATNTDYYTMLITPLDENKSMRDDVQIVYDRKRKIILEISTFLSPVTLSKIKDKKSDGSKNIFKSMFKAVYKIQGDNYYLLSSKEEIGFDRMQKKQTKSIEVRNYLVTTNFSNQKLTYKENEVFKDKTLLNKKNVIITDYWNNSGITATEEEQEIVNKLEQEN